MNDHKFAKNWNGLVLSTIVVMAQFIIVAEILSHLCWKTAIFFIFVSEKWIYFV